MFDDLVLEDLMKIHEAIAFGRDEATMNL